MSDEPRNEVTGDVGGSTVQAGIVKGGVHLQSPASPEPSGAVFHVHAER